MHTKKTAAMDYIAAVFVYGKKWRQRVITRISPLNLIYGRFVFLYSDGLRLYRFLKVSA